MGRRGDRPGGRLLDRLTGPDHARDDAGGVWIITGVVLGLVVYAGVVVAWHAGFTAAAPFVVIPAVLVVMVGAGNLLSGKRPGRPAPRFNRPDPVPLSSLRRDGGTPTGLGFPAPATSSADGATGADPDPTASGPGR
jgi:hypothetical protein